MENLALILMSASTQMFVIHKLRASTIQEDLSAVVTWDGEGKGHIQFALTSMNVQKEQIGNFCLCSIVVLTFLLAKTYGQFLNIIIN